MICNNTSQGVLNTLQFVLIETGQTSEQRVTIVQTTTNQGICSKDCHFRSEILSNSTEVTHLKGSRSNLVLGVDNKSGKIRTETYSGVFIRGLRVPSRFSPCKTHSREMAQTPGFDPKTQVKTCFDCKMFDVANWVACLNGENGPGGTPSHETLSGSSQGALEISSVAGQPPSLDRNHYSPPRLVAKSHLKGADLHPKTTVFNSLPTPQRKVGVLT